MRDLEMAGGQIPQPLYPNIPYQRFKNRLRFDPLRVAPFLCHSCVTTKAKQARIEGNTLTHQPRKRPIDTHKTASTRTRENTPFESAKPLFIGSIPIAASNNLNRISRLPAHSLLRIFHLGHYCVTARKKQRRIRQGPPLKISEILGKSHDGRP